MASKEQEYNKLLHKLAENLDISETMRDKAIRSYTAVGSWLGACSDDSDVKISPQGSFNLGTVIRPVDDKDEYDIDLVCILKDKYNASEIAIKHLVGNRLKEHRTYVKMLDREGKRCWTLHYDEFHMDILPSVPSLEVYLEPYNTDIRITKKVAPGVYLPEFSNPYKYHKWFEEQMKIVVLQEKSIFATRNQVEISEVPLYKVKTPLQRAIQLLKRHRDIMYKEATDLQKKNAPISMIITTLAAHAYNNESNIIEALTSILGKMQNYIEIRGDVYWVQNPAMPEENFAQKWEEEPAKRYEFYRWLKKAQEEILITPTKKFGLHNISEAMACSFGSNIVQKTFVDLGYETKDNRDAGNLYISGLTGGLTTSPNEKSEKVKGHTFFGKQKEISKS